jgi:predicted flavoprotein YhiN
VLWPVFTSDALVYQCGERIDLQAVAISSGGAGVSLGATAAGYPMCAAFVSDTTKLLNLIP